VFRNGLWALRQPRYATLAALMFVVALLCVAAGTWQISRYHQKVRENDVLRGNARHAAVPLSTALVPLVGHGNAPGEYAIRYRAVTVTGSYLPHTQYVQAADANNTDGFQLLSPFRTRDGVLLVVRGFVPQTPQAAPPAGLPGPPSGRLTLTGRLQPADTGNDGAGQLPTDQLATVNPRQQAARLDAPVFDAYLDLDSHQPGTAALQALATPDLSNPAGGAAEWQHLAYIVQWYVFALLALAAPFIISRHEVREAQQLYLGYDPDSEQLDAELAPAPDRAALPAGEAAELVLRERAGLVHHEPTRDQWERAARLADRYGRSLGRGREPTPGYEPAPGHTPPARRTRREPAIGHDYRPATSATRPARSRDSYHAEYNDYLWQLAMADGDLPELVLPGDEPAEPADEPAQPVVIDVEAKPDS
jgi:cytochrome oxidase assembly protein ShyY1